MRLLTMLATLLASGCAGPAVPTATCAEFCDQRVACGTSDTVSACLDQCRNERNIHHTSCQSAFDQLKACELAHPNACPDGGLNRNGACRMPSCLLAVCDSCGGCGVRCDDGKCYTPASQSPIFCD